MSGQAVADIGAACPVRTLVHMSESEVARVGESQVRAYKLGKQRWSYNQCELLLLLEDTQSLTKQPRPVNVTQAVLIKDQADGHSGPSSSKISYRAQLSNSTCVIISFYLVYPEPSSTFAQQSSSTVAQTTEYSWTLVTRDHCKKGCKGPLLHPLRRLGLLGSRFTGPSARKADNSGSKQYKQSKYMYFAIDEAGTHVGSKAFRLIVAVHDETGRKLLGTTCSQPIRVVANNDIPQGAAHISLVATIREDCADQQPSSLRQPSVCLWPGSRLEQTWCDTQCDVAVCHCAGFEPTATGMCCQKAAELPLQSSICTADSRSTNTCRNQLRPITGIPESSRSGNEELHCKGMVSAGGLHRDAPLGNHDDPLTKPDYQLALQDCEGAHQDSAKRMAELGETAKQEHEANFDPADTLLCQLGSEQLPPSPVALWDTNLIGTQSGVHPFTCGESLCEECSGLEDHAPGPVASWERDLMMRGQTYGNVLMHHPTSELPSSRRWSSHQHSNTPRGPDDSHSEIMPGMTGNSFKRARCMHPEVDCASGLTSSSLLSRCAPDHIHSPWRICMRRGFLCPASTSCVEDDGSPSGASAPVERQASVTPSTRTCIAQLEDQLEMRTNDLENQRALTSVLDARLVLQQQEIQCLRNRVCQLQHGQYIRKSLAARTST